MIFFLSLKGYTPFYVFLTFVFVNESNLRILSKFIFYFSDYFTFDYFSSCASNFCTQKVRFGGINEIIWSSRIIMLIATKIRFVHSRYSSAELRNFISFAPSFWFCRFTFSLDHLSLRSSNFSSIFFIKKSLSQREKVNKFAVD